jgi:Family of unknown function (DUF5681)
VPDDTGEKQERSAGGQWASGISGNPAGRPPGARNRATLAAAALLEAEAEGIARKAVELALGGDLGAIKLCLERLLPPLRERPLRLDLPLRSPGDADAAILELLEAVRRGELTASELQALTRLVATFVDRARDAQQARRDDRFASLLPQLGSM